jgi:hypothetical protein
MINILGLLKRLELQGDHCPVCREHINMPHDRGCLLNIGIKQLEAEGGAIREGAYRVLVGLGLA